MYGERPRLYDGTVGDSVEDQPTTGLDAAVQRESGKRQPLITRVLVIPASVGPDFRVDFTFKAQLEYLMALPDFESALQRP